MASLASTSMSKLRPSCPRIPANTHRCPISIPLQLQFPGRKAVLSTIGTVKATSQGGSQSPGLYSSQKFELTPKNVDLVLEDVRPYLIADGGNVDVVSVEDGVISLQLQG